MFTISFTEFLKLHNFKQIHSHTDDQGVYNVYSNDTYTIKLYINEEGAYAHLFFKKTDHYVLEVDSIDYDGNFLQWNTFLSK